MDYTERIALPPADALNTGLLSPGSIYLTGLLGLPGMLTADCSEPSPRYSQELVTADVGPFHVTGHKAAVLGLRHVFEDVAAAGKSDLLAGVKTAGMLCVRAMRRAPRVFSNHSWGLAVDLYFGDDVVPFGESKCERGTLALYPYFHARGWYWGGGYHDAARADSMHFEESVHLLDTWQRLGMI